MKIKGIDVSRHQGLINWSHVKNDGIEFAIIRAGYGKEYSQKDEQFENNYAGCRSNQVDCGVYWYSYATTVEAAEKEAEICIETIKGKVFEYPIYIDIEEKRHYELGAEKCSAIAKAFCEKLEKAGYWAGIYSYKNFLENRIIDSVRNRFVIWVAHTGVEKTSYTGDYEIWQYSHEGDIAGIDGNTDCNYCYTDYPTRIKNAGLNGFKNNNTTEEIIKYTVQKGDTLTDISKKYNTTISKIVADNNIENPDLIFEGQELIIK